MQPIKKANNIPSINPFFSVVNQKLSNTGIFVVVVETYQQRKKRLFAKYPQIISNFYVFLDFIFKRIFPKLSITKKLYTFITADRNRAMSLTDLPVGIIAATSGCYGRTWWRPGHLPLSQEVFPVRHGHRTSEYETLFASAIIISDSVPCTRLDSCGPVLLGRRSLPGMAAKS